MKIICFLGGMLLGGVLVYFVFERKMLSPIIYNAATANAGVYHHVLVDLREGKTNAAINILEMKLDGELITFFNYDKNQPKINPSQFKIISRIATYRREYPRKSESSEVDAMVQKVLAMPAPSSSSP